VVGVLARVARTGAIADTRRAVREHAKAARAALNALPDRSDRRALEAIVHAATTRDH
jgi:geranylgeranyl pyrophosphate synthase